ncbi:MAG: Uma2 family endonuclease [Myxococcaceae bacterium]|nr:Uma2 family endonuclease [Myxococcaceae bacterium]
MDVGSFFEPVPVPRGAVQFPLVVEQPPGFKPEEPSTWPEFPGRWEYLGGRLLFMPPCGDEQADVATATLWQFEPWVSRHPEFVVGANEAGMILGGEVRGADAAVWRRDQLGAYSGKYRRTAPVLVVEIAGADEPEERLREKARWYLERGVRVAWLVVPGSREVIVVHGGGESRHRPGERLPTHDELPELEPDVSAFFRQLQKRA